MKRTAAALLAALAVCLFAGTLTAFADETDVTNELERATHTDTLYSDLPDEATDLLSAMGITRIGRETAAGVDLSAFFSAVLPSVKRQIKAPVRSAAAALIVVLTVSLIGLMPSARRGRSVERLSAAVCALTVLPGLTGTILQTSAVTKTAAGVLTAYAPVLAGLTAAAGRPAVSAAGSAFLIGFAAIVETAADRLIVPVAGMLVALAAVTAGDESPAGAFADLLFSVFKWGLTLLSTLSGALFALQTGIAAAHDSLSLRSARFAVSGLVPVVGGMLSEALGTVLSSAAIIRSSVGVIGVLCVVGLFLPTVVELFVWSGVCRFLAFFADSARVTAAGRLFDRLRKTTDVLLAAVAVTAVLAVFATAVLLKAGATS